MSIVERALHKAQGSKPPQAEVPPTVISRAAAGKARDIVGPGATQTHAVVAERRHAESIKLDPTSLRELGVLPPQGTDERLTEQFRRVKRPIVDFASGRRAEEGGRTNVAMVTSSVAGEGKTFTSFNLALSIARERDVSVLLVDADVAKRHISEAVGLKNRKGLIDALADATLDPESLVLDTDVQTLTILPAGRHSSTAPELFASERMSAIVRLLSDADQRRIVLFDSSPLLLTNESQALARLVDQVVLVVRAESTPQPVLTEAIGLLDHTKTIRCILNQARTSGMSEYYYGYGYHQHDRPAE
jgi:exopolysaccharide/PEP-CTERM locus tyrosine autokinase